MKVILLLLLLLICGIYSYYKNEQVEHFVPTDILTDYRHIKSLNDLIKKSADILHKNKINYWMCGGTLLGSIREQGTIPWDDDADICMMEEDVNKLLKIKDIFKTNNIGIVDWFGGYKLYELNGQDIPEKNFKYPFIDIFIMEKENNKIILKDEYSKNLWPNEYYLIDELYPLKLYKYEDFELYGPSQPTKYLDRSFTDWKTKAMSGYDHVHHKNREKKEFSIDYDCNNKPYLWQYWDNINSRETPAYIKLCMKTVDKHCSNSFNIIRLNKNNVYTYLPELLKYKDKIEKLIIAHQVDIFRIYLLYKYGGIYVDADVVVLRDPKEVTDKLRTYDFVGFGCTGDKCKNGYPNPSNWILASRPTSILMAQTIKNILGKLESDQKFEYHDIGKLVLWHEIEKLMKSDKYTYFHYPNKIDGSRDRHGNWIDSNIAFSDRQIEYEDENNMIFFVVYNSGATDKIRQMTETEILAKDWNFSKFVKKALGDNITL